MDDDPPSPVDQIDQIASRNRPQRLKELAWVFFKLGTIAFGGPAAHIALMEDEVVQWRQWMSREKLLDLLGITNLIPGPNSTELAIHIGYERAGWAGLMVAGACFILPATLMVWAIAALYVQYQTVPQVEGLLYGIKPMMIAIVLQAIWKLGKSAFKNRPTVVAGCITAVLFAGGMHELGLLLLAGLGVMLFQQRGRFNGSAVLLPMSGLLAQVSVVPITEVNVFLVFLKIGSVLYGSGYVLLAFLQRELVERSHWLTQQQLLDAIAVGQITPGPVFTTATFVGYLLAGNEGAIAGTLGIFLPAFAFVALVNPLAAQLRRSAWASGFLDGVNAASLGLMAVVTWSLAEAALVDGPTFVLAILGGIALIRFQVNSIWLILAGAIAGLAFNLL